MHALAPAPGPDRLAISTFVPHLLRTETSAPLILALAITALALVLVLVFLQHRMRTLRALLARAEYDAGHDFLTGLPSRQAALAHLAAGAVTLVGVLDVDHFKSINDRFGHLAGDQVLTALATRLRTAIAGHGITARLSGDEFLLLWTEPVPDPIAQATALLQSLTLPFALPELSVNLTVSLGIARPSPHLHGRDLLAAADMALYTAKETTGMSLSIYDSPYPPPPMDRRSNRSPRPGTTTPQPPPPRITATTERTPMTTTTSPRTRAGDTAPAVPAPAARAAIPPPPAITSDRTAPLIRMTAAALLLSILTTLFLTIALVVFAPWWLAGQDLYAWAASSQGLGLSGAEAFMTVLAVIGAAFLCVVLSTVSTWRGYPSAPASRLVWMFAFSAALACWRHAGAGAAADASWFFPAMCLIGPGFLQMLLNYARTWATNAGIRASADNTSSSPLPWQRWVPGLGSFRDSYGAYRVQVLMGVDSPAQALKIYRDLCPGRSLRVANAIHRRDLAQSQAEALSRLNASAASGQDGDLPADIMRRIPVDTDTYEHWRQAWSDLCARETPGKNLTRDDLSTVAASHLLSDRDLKYVRQIGPTGLLHSPTPPAVLLVNMAKNHY